MTMPDDCSHVGRKSSLTDRAASAVIERLLDRLWDPIMRANVFGWTWTILAASILGLAPEPSQAAEGTTAAGPIGGSDIRSAMLPPPGVYGGVVGLVSHVSTIDGGNGHSVPGLDAVDLTAKIAAPFLLYVPDAQILGGSIGVFGVTPGGQECGQVISTVPRRCTWGFGDPYIEVDWSRSFGHLRSSRDATAFPIMEGLVVSLGLGAVLPVGKYEPDLRATNAISLGNNIWDIAPSIAVTYTTPPLIAEGTEFSGKLYWNNYSTNPDSQYQAAPLLDLDFAITEHFGRFQAGLAGIHAFQMGADRQFGIVVPPDGRRLEFTALGLVVNYDMPNLGAAIRFKALSIVDGQNTGISNSATIGFAKKLF
jgi:hypothetical protein